MFWLSFFVVVDARDELNLQIGMQIWDQALYLKDGFYEGILTKKKNIFTLKQAAIKIWKQKEHLLIVGLNELGEEKWKLLKNSKKNLAYFFKISSSKIELISHHSEIDIIPEFDFSLADLLFYRIEERFLPKSVVDYQSQNNSYFKIELEPIRESPYQKIFIYISKESQSPYKMDVFLSSGEFHKIIQLDLDEEKNFLKRILATNTTNSEKSILEFKNYKPLEIPEYLFDLSHLANSKLGVYP